MEWISFLVVMGFGALAFFSGLVGAFVSLIWEQKFNAGTFVCLVVAAIGILLADVAYLHAPFSVAVH